MIVTDASVEKPDSSMNKSEAPLPALPTDQAPFVLPANVKPSNFLSFTQKHNSVKGTFVLDPSLEIPSDWLPPLPEEETEETRSNLYAKSEHGNHREGPSPPFALNANAPRGNVTVRIPRSYKGSITASTKYGRVSMSDGVSGQASVFSDLQGVKRVFVGDITARSDQTDDAMVLDTEHGCVRISFEDEDFGGIRMPKSVTGLFSRLFG
ncbi:hypothetical protein BDP27DRAFT_1361133 [Rhodocollybia butyracea]|uniref:DUF7330 domain-containing protein n=1 Tax=Rhodocollybia butyracea TaxID=206335 RepID=A0A9P5UAQ8_9AGAR|nr:hypothetical protein BDP27DRAFT_1361133 [Rhodocollybia butyracea]